MILLILLWLFVFIICFIPGYAIHIIISSISSKITNKEPVSTDVCFFLGFLTLSVVVGILSIFIPVGAFILCLVLGLSIFLLFFFYKGIINLVKETISYVSEFSRLEVLFLLFIIAFILASASQRITLGDTESYHAQSIQWVRKFAVVPGLGNIHGRLAFNSMFFVISGLFSFQIKDILIFPLNGVSYIVLIFKLFSLYRKERAIGVRWKAVLYILLFLISLLILLPNLNSPAPDVMCSVLIMYCFVLIMELETKDKQHYPVHLILLNLVVFSCIAFKISSLLLIISLLFLFDREIIKRALVTFFIGILVLLPFFIRNYYLSGYVIYPFPFLDIFNVDWKIPFDDVLSMKLEIASWAKISTLPASDVINLKISEWIIPWFKALNFNHRMILFVNLFSVFFFFISLVKKEYFLAFIQVILLINLIFWFLQAPDPRFAYGFLFIGFSLNLAMFTRIFDTHLSSSIFKFAKIGLTIFLLLVVCRRIKQPTETLITPSTWFLPAPFATVATNEFNAGFQYSVPVPEGGCYNVEIPCVPYPLSNIVLRGADIQDGFKVIKKNP